MGTQPGHAKLRITDDAVGRRGIIGVDDPIGCTSGIVGLVGVGGIRIVELVGVVGIVGTVGGTIGIVGFSSLIGVVGFVGIGCGARGAFRGVVPRVVVPDVVVWGVVPVVLPRRARPEVRVMDARPT